MSSLFTLLAARAKCRLFRSWNRIRRVANLALPIVGGMSTYVVLELVDLWFVGKLGTTALAAAGIAVFISFLYFALFGGVAVAVQTATSRLVGERGNASGAAARISDSPGALAESVDARR